MRKSFSFLAFFELCIFDLFSSCLRPFFLISCSALLLGCSFVFPVCSWGVFLFLIPIFYSAWHYRLSFLYGLWWGIIFWSIHAYSLLITIVQKSDAGVLPAAGIWFLLILYASLYCGCWFFLAQCVSRRTKWFFLPWTLSTWFYFFFVDRAMLWIFDVVEGYGLAHPLLPLLAYRNLISLVPFFGKHVLFLFVIIVQIGLVGFLVDRRKYLFFAFSVVGVLPFLGSIFFPPKLLPRPAILDHIIYVCIKAQGSTAWEYAHALRTVLGPAVKTEKIVLMPESTFPFCLNEYPLILDYLNSYVLNDEKELILGGHRRDGDKIYNSMYHIRGNTVVSVHDKQHGMYFVERIPQLFNFPIFQQLFLQACEPFAQSKEKSSKMDTRFFTFAPLICSELFFYRNFANESAKLYLVLVNDSWYSCEYQRNLMQKDAQMKAMLWRKSIIYISHYGGLLFDAAGSCWQLERTENIFH